METSQLYLYFLGLMIGSFAQPMNDLSFTACQLIYNGFKSCSGQGRNATFIFLLIYIFFRIIQSVRLHKQYSPNIVISRGRQGLLACIFLLNTVISSYLYGTYKSSQMLTYWIVSASISTITATNADLRVNWELITFD